ncbi:MAG: TIGR00282 family metallophosphoesterase [Firmicutes bacterium]|nr:TIGR00282 family metallophosphoesterase [Bacillota bacterium]
MNILFIGDIVGAPGRRMVSNQLPRLIDEYRADLIIANGENCAGGFGITRKAFQELHACGVDVFTMGNHTWDNRDIFNFIQDEKRLLRPANLPPGLPGRGMGLYRAGDVSVAVINLLGRVYMAGVDCPFRTVDKLLEQARAETPYVFVDFHAEATSEKIAMGWYVDGRASVCVGTHTHVQTADARILPKGTGFITDVGMTGPRDSVLGVDKDIIVKRFLDGLPAKFATARGDLQFNGIVAEIDGQGHCQSITPLHFWEPAL